MLYILGSLGDWSRYTSPFLAFWNRRHRHIELAETVSWSDFAYCTYATAPVHLCNSLMLLESLHRVQVKADRLLVYTNEWDVEATNSTEARLLRQARDQYGVILQPVDLLRPDNLVNDPTWADSFTKLLAFNQTQYKRIITLDSDGTVLRGMDELFLMPPAPMAMPRAYWMDNGEFTTQLNLVQPSNAAFTAIQEKLARREKDEYDGEIINDVFGLSCAAIPHRPYNLLTGEFRYTNHSNYLGSVDRVWDAEKVIEEAKYVQFVRQIHELVKYSSLIFTAASPTGHYPSRGSIIPRRCGILSNHNARGLEVTVQSCGYGRGCMMTLGKGEG
jgi:hypothetical protein